MYNCLRRYRSVPNRPRRAKVWLLAMALLAAVVVQGGCGKRVVRGRPSPLGPTYTGPGFLHGTIGSLTRLRGYEPLLVSGYGLVVNLDGTGSAEVPAYLRRWLINEMRKRGVGSASLNASGMSPERMLSSLNTAVVAVQGLIPPGAAKGRRFDVLVSSLPQTQTTSLEGGRLWTVDLAEGGDDPSLGFNRNAAQASGPMYVNPFDDASPQEKTLQLSRQAVALSGGVATQSRSVDLVLNQPSWQRSRLIADRINERFPKAQPDALNTAVPINDSLITLNIPSRFGGQTEELLRLIRHVYVQRAPGFEQSKAGQLTDLLVAQPRFAPDITLAWVAMGRTVLPVIRPLYEHKTEDVRLAALETGARLGDEVSAIHLSRLASRPETELRRRAAQMLAHLPRSLRGAGVLHGLLDDVDRSVRILAYESLAAINDPLIQRMVIDGPDADRFKFVLDLVPSKRPLIYIAQRDVPRLVIFNPLMGLDRSFLAKLWDNHLMIRADGAKKPMAVFYQRPGTPEGKTFEIPRLVTDLAYLLAHRPTVGSPRHGLDLTYGQVVGVIYQLSDRGHIPGGVELQITPLATAIARAQESGAGQPRPETEGGGSYPTPAGQEGVPGGPGGLWGGDEGGSGVQGRPETEGLPPMLP